MGFWEAIQTCFRKYVDFSGRASRSEFWYFQLFVVIMRIGLGTLDGVLFQTADKVLQRGSGFFEGFAVGYHNTTDGILTGLFNFAVFLPSLAVMARRLHDTGRSGWWQGMPYALVVIFLFIYRGGMSAQGDQNITVPALISGLTIFIGIVMLIVWLATRGTRGSNRFGADPLSPPET